MQHQVLIERIKQRSWAPPKQTKQEIFCVRGGESKSLRPRVMLQGYPFPLRVPLMPIWVVAGSGLVRVGSDVCASVESRNDRRRVLLKFAMGIVLERWTLRFQSTSCWRQPHRTDQALRIAIAAQTVCRWRLKTPRLDGLPVTLESSRRLECKNPASVGPEQIVMTAP